MKKLSIISACALLFGLMAGPVMAQTYIFDVDPTAGKDIQTDITISAFDSVTLDMYLSGAGAPQNAGGFWLDFTGSTADISYVSATQAIPPWIAGGVIVNEPAGPGTLLMQNANLGSGAAPDGDGDILIGSVTLQGTSVVPATLTLSIVPGGSPTLWSPLADATVVSGNFTVQKDCCMNVGGIDPSCATNNGLWCDGYAICSTACTCTPIDTNPCDDGDSCTLDICTEADTPGDTVPGTCSYECNATSGTDPCMAEDICSGAFPGPPFVIVEPAWATPGNVGVKVDLCLENINNEVGAFQVDICEEIDGVPVDCLTCVGCEMTERTVLFDCFVYELDDGCCRVILISKHPGGVINPGVCSVVKIDYTLCDPDDPECPEECNSVDCIRLTPENIVIADPYGHPLGAGGMSGEVCPFECGDVDPPESAPDAKDCGDGDVDLVDIITEVNFALSSVIPDDCQKIRGDVPTGTPGYGEPPYCTPPDGVINVLDVMVLIDMALDRQDCCTYYYTGGIY